VSVLMKDSDLSAIGVTIAHHMPDDGSGVYIKEPRIPMGVKLPMHSHTFTHKSVLVSGMATVMAWRDGGFVLDTIVGPAISTMKHGTAHDVTAVTDCVWLCIHATDECDHEKIDETLVAHA